MGIEPTNKGLAGHRLNTCNPLIPQKITLEELLVGPVSGPSIDQSGLGVERPVVSKVLLPIGNLGHQVQHHCLVMSHYLAGSSFHVSCQVDDRLTVTRGD